MLSTVIGSFGACASTKSGNGAVAGGESSADVQGGSNTKVANVDEFGLLAYNEPPKKTAAENHISQPPTAHDDDERSSRPPEKKR